MNRRFDRSLAAAAAAVTNLLAISRTGRGASRMSARELKEEVEAVSEKIRETYARYNSKDKNKPLEGLSDLIKDK